MLTVKAEMLVKEMAELKDSINELIAKEFKIEKFDEDTIKAINFMKSIYSVMDHVIEYTVEEAQTLDSINHKLDLIEMAITHTKGES